MNTRIQARVRKLLTIDELLMSRMFRFANEFGLEITEDSINTAKNVNAFKVQEQETEIPSDSDFMSILLFLYILSHTISTHNVCSELFLNYLDTVFQYKHRKNELRVADIFFYEVFTDRMSEHR